MSERLDRKRFLFVASVGTANLFLVAACTQEPTPTRPQQPFGEPAAPHIDTTSGKWYEISEVVTDKEVADLYQAIRNMVQEPYQGNFSQQATAEVVVNTKERLKVSSSTFANTNLNNGEYKRILQTPIHIWNITGSVTLPGVEEVWAHTQYDENNKLDGVLIRGRLTTSDPSYIDNTFKILPGTTWQRTSFETAGPAIPGFKKEVNGISARVSDDKRFSVYLSKSKTP